MQAIQLMQQGKGQPWLAQQLPAGAPAEPEIERLFVAAGSQHALPIFMTRYTAATFERSMFERSAIECPPHIARSVRKRQAEYFHGRLCSKHALQAAGLGEHPVRTGQMREPVWPFGMIGSITHNHEFALAVAMPKGRGQGVGIDVETIVDEQGREALAATAVNAAELAYLQSLGSVMPLDCLLTMVFSAKESFFKACFPTIRCYLDFDAVTVKAIDQVSNTVVFSVAEALPGLFAAGDVCRVSYRFLNEHTIFTTLHI